MHQWYLYLLVSLCNFFFAPNEYSKENTFFFMFRRDAYTPLAQLLNPKLRYVGNDKSILAFYDIYALAIHNIKL